MEKYQPKNPIRIVTATSLFDGHDAAINIMRRILQYSGAEVIHLGHNRSVQEIVDCALQEDVQAIAISSYQGGHLEFFKYMYDLLAERGMQHVQIFGGGGGVILPSEIEELQNYGIARIYSPDDGRTMGLQGMINDMLQRIDFEISKDVCDDCLALHNIQAKKYRAIAKTISAAENFSDKATALLENLKQLANQCTTPVIGITGTGGSGKSSLIDELVRRFVQSFENKTIAIISVDPTKRKTGGALLGDRIRMNSVSHPRVYMRSLATRQANLALSRYVADALNIVRVAGFDLIILETSGIGQSDTEIVEHSNISMYVMTPEFGAPTQLEKIDMLDFADLIVLNKADKRGAADALQYIRKQVQRNQQLWEKSLTQMPVYSTIASQFNDSGVNQLFNAWIETIKQKTNIDFWNDSKTKDTFTQQTERQSIIPPSRVRYLSEISETIRNYNQWAENQANIAQKLYSISTVESLISSEISSDIKNIKQSLEEQLVPSNKKIISEWNDTVKRYKADEYVYRVRNKDIKIETHVESLSHTRIPKISLPKYQAWGDVLRWNLKENVPGEFPFAGGVFPFKREQEDPTRMFAGEGGPERTNKRFHYVSLGLPAKRLSTAFDSVTLYGNDPDLRPDIFGKIGNSGVSICCLDDAKKLYSGFDLASPTVSVSMTINGPAPIMLAYFMLAAIDQQCDRYIVEHNLVAETEHRIETIFKQQKVKRPRYNGALPEGNSGLGLMLLGVTGDQVLPADVYERIKFDTFCKVRGTVQADILKEDQAQNTCIFSADFSLQLMGDVQQFFIENKIGNFYSVSISGYHIAEAGANPITQLAFTLANGFTYIEYYLSRGMNINDFAPNLSFFFSNGIDAEYAVIGRVARLIWAKAMKMRYNANVRSQMLKYHIQTSGRSLHAQEIGFNDIRTTLQALYAIYDNCNSLHTNAYDEAITTPTEESVRRAMAIQMIINHELGLAKNQNPNQGSFIIEELTDLVEEAVLAEFDRITERGGVLGAMESMYQRSKIQEESLYYETLKHTGTLPIMGVNTFLSASGSPTVLPQEVIRSTDEEKQQQIETLENLHKLNKDLANEALTALKKAAVKNQNTFAEIMEAAKYCSLGQITSALYEVGGQYRRNM